VNGSVTTAPSAGETGDGAGGAAAAPLPLALRHRIMANNSEKDGRTDIRILIIYPPMIDRIQRAIPRCGEMVFVAKSLFSANIHYYYTITEV
jgi:hypothetical protein